MAVSKNQVIIDILLQNDKKVAAKLNGIDEAINKLGKASRLNAINRDLSRLNLRLNSANRIINDTTGQFVSLGDAINRQVRMDNFNEGLQTARRVLLGVGLASLFFGMAIRNAAQNAIKSFARTFATVTEGTLLYNQTLGRLTAGFEFLKFSIMDAFLASSFGRLLIEVLLDIITFITDLPQGIQAAIVPFLIIVAVAGFLLMVFGQIALVLLGVVEIFELFLHHPKVMAKLMTKIKVIFAKIAVFLAVAAVVFATVAALIKIWNSEGNVFVKILVTAVILFFVMIAIAALLGITISAPFIALLAVIAAIAIGVKVAGAEMKLAFLKAALAINHALIKFVIDPLQSVLDMVNTVAGTNFRIGDTTRFAARDLGNQILETQAEISQQRAAKSEQEADTKGSAEKGMIFNIENLNSNNAEEFITSLKETSLFNKGAGIG
tara:strand:- start:701 stop:2011 length:1311 start_codon:yes stop_codon:yes gene_type:complete